MSAPRSLAAPARYLSRDEAKAIADRVLGFAAADETRVNINSGGRGNTRFAVNQISTAGDNYDATVSIRSVIGKRSGTVTTNKLDEASLRRAVQTAEQLAWLAPEDPEQMPELGAQRYEADDAWSDNTASLSPTARAAAVQAIATPSIKADLISTGYLEHQAESSTIANSRGLFAYGRSTGAVLTATVRTPDGTGSGWAGGVANDWSRINPAALGARALEKAKRSQNPVAIEPGRYTVVLEPTAVGNLVQLLSRAFSARSADEGRSFFSKAGGGTKIGERVLDPRVTLVSDPHDERAPTNTFTSDGMPVTRTTWIENGVVKTLAYDRYWAQQKNVEPTESGGSFIMSGGDSSLEDLIASTERGILVTRFWYIRGVDPRTILYTGLTRDGTFLIENGKVTRAVKNMRFNESPVFMLNNLEGMGRPERVSSSESGGIGQGVVVPPIKVRDFNFTSLSDAI